MNPRMIAQISVVLGASPMSEEEQNHRLQMIHDAISDLGFDDHETDEVYSLEDLGTIE